MVDPRLLEILVCPLCKGPLVHRKDRDFPAAWAKSYGKGRVFY
jgi:uncharacterized protein YbaR (Trm112 family)